jgi:mono/diheme cytochrome c family protein
MASRSSKTYYLPSHTLASIKLFRDFSLKTSKQACRLLPSTRLHGALLALGLACFGFGAEPSVAEEDAVKERFSLYCSVCHGDRGDGASHAQQGLVPPPRDFTDPAFGSAITRERLVGAITNGVPGTAMVAWQTELSAAEIDELADYILQNFIASPAPVTTVSHTQAADSETQLIYRESCSVCHGDDGKGAVWGQNSLSTTPRDFTTEQASIELTRDRMIMSVTHGRPGTPMPGFGSQLDDQQVANIVDYIRTRFMTTAANSDEQTVASDYHERPFPADLTGNFERGRSLYFQNCLECHGAQGAGDGPRAYFIFPRPRNFNDGATKEILNRPRLYDGVANGVIGREMPAWRFVFAAQDIADVSEFVYREFIATGGGTAAP